MSYVWVGDSRIYVPSRGTLTVTRRHQPEEKKTQELLLIKKEKETLQAEVAQLKQQVEELKRKNENLQSLDLR